MFGNVFEILLDNVAVNVAFFGVGSKFEMFAILRIIPAVPGGAAA